MQPGQLLLLQPHWQPCPEILFVSLIFSLLQVV
jgi:hypothetical protein